MKRTFAIVILSSLAAGVQAQERARAPHAFELEVHAADAPLHTQLRAAVETRTTRGAPYSAEATTEFTQVLGDGNRIVRKSVMRIYRDGEGRTRREPVSTSGESHEGRSITISDPMGGTSVILDPDTRTAYTSKGMVAVTNALTRIEAEHGRGHPVEVHGGDVRIRTPGPEPVMGTKIRIEAMGRPRGDTKREDLGQQTIDGMPALGTRTTTVIPAGAIGNEQPLTIVSEQWFSPELQVLVMTRHTDPRAGETVYRLTNVVRAEPDRTLFEVPADYTVNVAEQKPGPVRRRQ
jgi:hypothetical protein